MTTSPQELLKSVSSLEDKPISPAAIGYFHGLSQNDAHEVILTLFQALAADEGITRAFLARRLGKSPEQITRWLSAPGNWTLDTYTNFAISMGHKPVYGVEPICEMKQSNIHHHAVARAISITNQQSSQRYSTTSSDGERAITPTFTKTKNSSTFDVVGYAH